MSKKARMDNFINYRMKVTINDGRIIVGKLMAFDKHMNVVLGDAEEFRRLKPKPPNFEEREEKRTLGMLVLRGECVVSLSVHAKPPPEVRERLSLYILKVCNSTLFYLLVDLY
jgi:small nuclear ribonucleoprotein B and B'